MPFQAIAYAQRVRTGTPLSKLLFIKLVGDCHPDGYIDFEAADLCEYACAPLAEIEAAVAHLFACGLLRRHGREGIVMVLLPLSAEPLHLRKRPKLTLDQMKAISDMSSHRCCACRDGDVEPADCHADHIIPRSRGGADIEINLQLLCGPCNMKKHAREGWVNFL